MIHVFRAYKSKFKGKFHATLCILAFFKFLNLRCIRKNTDVAENETAAKSYILLGQMKSKNYFAFPLYIMSSDFKKTAKLSSEVKVLGAPVGWITVLLFLESNDIVFMKNEKEIFSTCTNAGLGP